MTAMRRGRGRFSSICKRIHPIKASLFAAAAALALTSGVARAQEFYLGQVLTFAGNFCPRGTVPAEGQLLAISSNAALFSLMGTIYGGDGRTTFALPDLRGRAAVGTGQGPGLSNLPQGAKGGGETHALSLSEVPAHDHGVTVRANGLAQPGSTPNPVGALPALSTAGAIYGTGTGQPMAAGAVSVTQNAVGGGQAFSIRDPFLALRHCVVSQGLYPSRN